MSKIAKKRKRIKIPGARAGYGELSNFFERHDGVELIERGVMKVDPDTSDLEAMLLDYWKQPNSQQLNIRIPRGAKRMIERLARRKTVEASTLVRMWVIEGMPRDASQP